MTTREALFEFLLRLADDRLILGHRTSEWCGHGPFLEEDIALSNLALDHIGQAANLLEYAAEIDNNQRDADDLAFFRNEREFRNIKMVELPIGDFAFTIGRELLFSAFNLHYLERLRQCKDQQVAGLASKGYSETQYHLRHSREWMIKLGDGTRESHTRTQHAIDELWPYTGELFDQDETEKQLITELGVPDKNEIQADWLKTVDEALEKAKLEHPSNDIYMQTGGRTGFHTEHLGHLLAEMQRLPRAYPNAEW